VAVAVAMAAAAADRGVHPGDIEVDPPTLTCAGFAWFFGGDANTNATARIEYRATATAEWRRGLDLFRVPRANQRPGLPPPADGKGDLFGGSLFDLTPATDYDVRLTLEDPDGGGTSRVVRIRTWTEPLPPPPRRTLHVRPGRGGGSGSPADPLRGLAAADAAARPGDCLLLHAGTYRGGVTLRAPGTAGAPIGWTAAGDGEAAVASGGLVLSAAGLSNLFLEGLVFRGGERALGLQDAQHVTVRRCRFDGSRSGIWAAGAQATRIFIADCTFNGPRTWPRPANDDKLGEHRGIEIGGIGSVVAWNRFQGYRDAADTIGGPPVRSIDICYNDIRACTDDGIELDYSDRNCRVFRNRIVDCYMGISLQPSFGGPNYAVRNVLYNLGLETFKLHVSPPGVMTVGGVLLHNTVVMQGPPLLVWASTNCVVRGYTIANNLFAGQDGGRAVDLICRAEDLRLDGNLYVGGSFTNFARVGGESYGTWEAFRCAGFEAHGGRVDGLPAAFADMRPPRGPGHVTDTPHGNWQPAPGGPAVDRAVSLPGINDAFRGAAPDVGAVELGEAPPHFGPRPPAASPAATRP